MPFVVGLTGGIASGKTTVANLFHDQFGIEIVDADVIAREVVEPGSEGLKAIEARYGSNILLADGTLNRAKLRESIFACDKEKAWINQLLHPMIREKMQADIAKASSPYALLVIPLMVENNLQSLANRVLVVDVDEQVQRQRTMERDGVPIEQVDAILDAQASRSQRLSIADDVIRNNATNQELLPQITELHQKYLEICRENR
ncbi:MULTISPECIES: dephospho-CoA kinase [Vibrio]|uniref:dephospho-CoA kinase n=1 Tax=Vibrio TaxID=662 RepID=UPI00207554B7|nr:MULTISPECIES: dephospho-CoA kinase [Vibrio]USD32134.1 dephospho-CoA kinase [Vibrio sp. SCSIO 43186]USD45177.1 dephospho-CoA kinase [Vibrio sp. SCSIO 43145]USD69260.1 dephospho-CoA kinase [Vibrio sp. SCSIO 43139]USD96948.1 dephospho-CoA kinase [Vibrio coralliilyticus]